MKSWKTTLFGALGALGVYFSNQADPAWLSIVGQVLTAASTFGLGLVAKDAGVTGPAK
jgi:hypothetical protein